MLRPMIRRPHLHSKLGWQLSRALHTQPVWGHHPPAPYEVPDFTPEELANRVRNASFLRLVESYRRHGHRAARLDPLDLAERPNVPALDPRRYGLKADPENSDLSSEVLPAEFLQDQVDTSGIMDFPDDAGDPVKSAEMVAKHLAQVYTGNRGYEFMHIPSKHERRFLEQLLERSHSAPSSDAEKLRHWALLSRSETFDKWAAKRFPNVKRYGLEGGEGMMVAMGVVFEEAAKRGVQDAVVAIPHRGRLNLLTQLLDLDMRLLIRKMRGLPTLAESLPSSQFTDDVLSHLFVTTEMADPSLRVHLLPNPSHLEAVGPVALGFARGLQMPYGSSSSSTAGQTEMGTKVLSVQVHGDAAFGGQGVVAESLNLASLPHFNVGGSIRIVVNNQLGYTTPGRSGRTSFYATDLAKSIAAPILHVNGDKIDDVARAMKLAVAYQQKFRKDIVIDLVVYRRRGHNELDEPAYTSPVMYGAIAGLPSVPQIYEKALINAGILAESVISEAKAKHMAELDSALAAAEPDKFTLPPVAMPRDWKAVSWPEVGEWDVPVSTGVDEATLRKVGLASVTTPDSITPHPRLKKMHMAKRLQSLETGEGIDFATCEALAFGSLMLEGYHVRICGQDSGRGTFSQRHAVVSDQTSDAVTVPLQSLASNGASTGTIEVVNSPLSEYAVIGFEQGLAWVSSKVLPIWEAQFGDFLNTAQVMIDTFWGSGEAKWGLQSSLTLLLPHGYDSAGPEHSSARIERMLQLSNEPLVRGDFVPNAHIVNVTTAAQYFHLLRRQMIRPYRKPLAVFSPKGILRLPAASSKIAELSGDTSFQPVLVDALPDPKKVARVVFLSGKMYYDLVKERSARKLTDEIAFVRIEEISPFPYRALEEAMASFSNATSFVWAQEEPENAGAYLFVKPRLTSILPEGGNLDYVGRVAMAAPAPGVASYFSAQKAQIFENIFTGV